MAYTITADEIRILRECCELQKRFFAGDKSVIGRAKFCEREADKILSRFPKEEEVNLFTEGEAE